MEKDRQGAGFTLIELMIVIVIISVLAAIAIPGFMMYRQKGFDGQANSDARTFYSACVADSFQSVIDRTYDATHLPQGYAGLKPASGSFSYTAATGGIACNVAFRHPQGTKTYTLDSSGNITASS